MSLIDKIKNWFGLLIGEGELLGLRYPVTSYHIQVTNDLWRGSRVTKEDVTWMKARKIKTIVNLCAENNTEAAIFREKGFNTFFIPVIDNTAPTISQVGFFLNLCGTKPLLPILVHCEAGKGRTGVMVACYRMAQGWSYEKALSEADEFGLEMPCQIEFLKAVDDWLNKRK